MAEQREESERVREYLRIRKGYSEDAWERLLRKQPRLRRLEEQLRHYDPDSRDKRAALASLLECFRESGDRPKA